MAPLRWRLEHALVPGYTGEQQIWIDRQGLIQAIHPQSDRPVPTADQVLDLEADWLSLGGVDLQINGALGLAFPEIEQADQARLQTIGEWLWQQGIDGYLPTIVTTAVEKIHQALAIVAQFQALPDRPVAKILGVHLEGPCLNPQKRGAHPESFLLPLTVNTIRQVIGDYPALVKIMTLAPELDESGDAIAALRQHNIIVSLGHSQATAAQAQRAFAQGATMVTHAFNAMPSLHHRQPGLLAAALMDPQVWCGVIGDGQHVVPLMLQLLLRMSSSQGLFLVSDALAPLGLADGVYPWDERQIEVKAGTARLADGTLSGTTLPLLAGVQNLVRWQVCSVEDAIAMATEAPRQAIGLPGIGPGQPATHLLRWRHNPVDQSLTWQRMQRMLVEGN